MAKVLQVQRSRIFRSGESAFSAISVLFLIIIFTLSCWMYWPALHGPFFLDSQKLYGLERLFIERGWKVAPEQLSFSYDYGRLLSMFSFYANIAVNEGVSSLYIKITNLVIHLFNVVLLYHLTRLLLSINLKTKEACYLSLTICSLWALAPINIGAVSYAIQRMTLISAAFMLLAMICFVQIWVLKKEGSLNRKILVAYLSAILFCLILGGLSKETTALLPIYFIVIFFLMREHKLDWIRIVGLIAAALITVIVVYLVCNHIGLLDYSNKEYGPYKRLLTQSRVIVSYFFETIFPTISATNLYRDGYSISNGLLDPKTTLLSVLFLCSLLFVALVGTLRRIYPYVAFGILFFFASHTVESTFLPLEIYFEHRNYLASWGALFAIVYSVCGLLKGSRTLTVFIFFTWMGLFLIVGHAKSLSWANENRALRKALQQTPVSPRAISHASSYELSAGNSERALELLERSFLDLQIPNSKLSIQYLFTKCVSNKRVLAEDLNRLIYSPVGGASIEVSQALANLLKLTSFKQCEGMTDAELESTLKLLATKYEKNNKDTWNVDYYRVELALRNKNYDLVENIFTKTVLKEHDQAAAYYRNLLDRGILHVPD